MEGEFEARDREVGRLDEVVLEADLCFEDVQSAVNGSMRVYERYEVGDGRTNRATTSATDIPPKSMTAPPRASIASLSQMTRAMSSLFPTCQEWELRTEC